MYAQMSHNHSVYNGLSPAPYHYDRSLRVSNQEYMHSPTTSPPPPPPLPAAAANASPPNDPYCWYSEPAYTGIPVPSQKSLQYLFSPVPNNNPRPVIPSKRAAQNRAAQRAFRLRKERYVKDLEQKAKLMEDMKAELDQLRKENQMLKDTTLQLEKHISNNNIIKQEEEEEETHIQKRKSVTPIQTQFQPVSLRAPESFGSPTTSCSSASSNDNYWQPPTTAPLDFEPFEYIPHCDQRAERSPFVMVPHYPIMQHNNTILMSRNY